VTLGLPQSTVEMTATKEPSGALVIRAWVEPGSATQLRARITQSRDLHTQDHTVTTAATIDDVLASVRDWLESLLENRA
jgi:hypothetical protein